jgi:hypothetical protein
VVWEEAAAVGAAVVGAEVAEVAPLRSDVVVPRGRPPLAEPRTHRFICCRNSRVFRSVEMAAE